MSGDAGRAAGQPPVATPRVGTPRSGTPRVGTPFVVPALPPGATMALWPLGALADGGEPGQPLYVSAGKWLHPLFDLLEDRATLEHAGDLFLRDRVIGRGAAFLILRAGIRNAWADVVSDGAMSVFAAHGASLGGGELVPAIACRTEPLLRDVDDPDLAWKLLRQRRAAGRARSPGLEAPLRVRLAGPD